MSKTPESEGERLWRELGPEEFFKRGLHHDPIFPGGESFVQRMDSFDERLEAFIPSVVAKRAAIKRALKEGKVNPCEVSRYHHYLERTALLIRKYEKRSGIYRERLLFWGCCAGLAFCAVLLLLRLSSIL